MKYFVEKGSGYEFGIQGDDVFITKSPKSKASRKNLEKLRKVQEHTRQFETL